MIPFLVSTSSSQGTGRQSASLQQFLGYQEWAWAAPLKSNAAARILAAARRQTTDGEPNEKSSRVAEARTDHAATRVPMRVGGARRLRMPGTSDKLADAMSCGPGVEAHSSFSAGRCCARVHRFQHFCRRRVRASGVEGWLGRIFQAELHHLRRARSTQLLNKCQHEIDPGLDAPSRKYIAVPHDAALIDDGAKDRKQIPPCPVAGRT